MELLVALVRDQAAPSAVSVELAYLVRDQADHMAASLGLAVNR